MPQLSSISRGSAPTAVPARTFAMTTRFGELFLCQKLLVLQLGDAFSIPRNHRVGACIDDAIKELTDLLFKRSDLGVDQRATLIP